MQGIRVLLLSPHMAATVEENITLDLGKYA